jgi:hypothetical protein
MRTQFPVLFPQDISTCVTSHIGSGLMLLLMLLLLTFLM